MFLDKKRQQDLFTDDVKLEVAALPTPKNEEFATLGAAKAEITRLRKDLREIALYQAKKEITRLRTVIRGIALHQMKAEITERRTVMAQVYRYQTAPEDGSDITSLDAGKVGERPGRGGGILPAHALHCHATPLALRMLRGGGRPRVL